VALSRPAHHTDSGFQNPWPGSAPHGFSGVIRWMLTRRRRSGPELPAPTRIARPSPVRKAIVRDPSTLAVTWVGHTTFLIQISGINFLTDPIWSDRASPLSFVGPKRLVPAAVDFSDLPDIHATLVSHDHYDHLDDPTVRRLIDRFPSMQWIVPLGVAAFMKKRNAVNVAEMDWWEQRDLGAFSVACTPARHFSGRLPWNRNSTLWCGWTVSAGSRRIFFAGDTGLHAEFKEIAGRFGPFDVAILPIGAYEPRWFMQPVHMNPADAVEAFEEIVAAASDEKCIMIPSHWGTFVLTDEPPGEPPVLTRQVWSGTRLDPERLSILSQGETLDIGHIR